MVVRLAGLGVFRKLHRNQVVDQADEARPAARSQACENRGFLEMVVRHQDIDWSLTALTQTGEQTRLAAGERGEAAAPSETPDFALIAGGIDAAAPRRANRRDKTFRYAPRHKAQPAGERRRGNEGRWVGGDQMLGIGQFNPVDPGRRLAPGARQQPR